MINRSNSGATTSIKALIKFIDPEYKHPNATMPYVDWTPEKMRALREHLGWTQMKMGAAIGINDQTYHSWENDKRANNTKLGVRKLKDMYDQKLTPVFQACVDATLQWALGVGSSAYGNTAALERVRPHGDGWVRTQIGHEFEGLFIADAEIVKSIAQHNRYEDQLRAAGGHVADKLAS